MSEIPEDHDGKTRGDIPDNGRSSTSDVNTDDARDVPEAESANDELAGPGIDPYASDPDGTGGTHADDADPGADPSTDAEHGIDPYSTGPAEATPASSLSPTPNPGRAEAGDTDRETTGSGEDRASGAVTNSAEGASPRPQHRAVGTGTASDATDPDHDLADMSDTTDVDPGPLDTDVTGTEATAEDTSGASEDTSATGSESASTAGSVPAPGDGDGDAIDGVESGGNEVDAVDADAVGTDATVIDVERPRLLPPEEPSESTATGQATDGTNSGQEPDGEFDSASWAVAGTRALDGDEAEGADAEPPAAGSAAGDDLTDGGRTEPAGSAKSAVAAAGGSGGSGGPGKGGTGPAGRRPRSRRAKYTRRACYVLGVLLLLPIIAFAVIYVMTPIPSTTQPAAKAQQSVFYYRDGKTVIARSGDFDRRPVDLNVVPKHVIDAVISAENRSFYSDPGVSVKGSARAVWATLRGGSMQGGSTITQQMVRNYYSGLSQQRTASRKLKEIMIALKVGREKDKDWILQQYLNTIFFGRDAYGIESAAHAYYGKDVKQLTPAEGAYLAAAIQVPTYAGDLSTPGARGYMQARWRYVLDGMVQMQAITPQQAATMVFPEPQQQPRRSIYAGDKGYMVVQAKAELRKMGYTDNQINMGGLKVRTTFDKNLMSAARQAVESNLPPGTPAKVGVGLMAVDPSSGEVTAMYGGKNYIDQPFDNAFDAEVQAGSGFKPYVLAAALNDGESLNTYVDGSSPQTFAGTPIHNDQNENFGLVNLVTATQDSINTAYINLGQKVGLDKVVTMAEKLGIPAAQLEHAKDAPTLPLGVADVSVEQQAAAYAAFASEGLYHAPHVLKSVTDRDGKVHKLSEKGKRVFSTTVARDATYAMQRVVDAGTGVNASLPDRNAAGKTGTTSNGKQIWFNGFIPQIAASVGIFRSDNKPLNIPGYSAYGGELPAKIWRSFIEQADRGMPVKSFGAPSVYTGGGRTTTPVVPRPRPSESHVEPTPIIPSHDPPTEPPTEPPTGPPTGPPASPVPVDRQRGGPGDTSG
jgi:membrane peptidoglycan carboxypeptidase